MGHGHVLYLIYSSKSSNLEECIIDIIVSQVLTNHVRIPCVFHCDGFPARDEMLPDTFKCSTANQTSRTFMFFMELPPPLAQPPLSHHIHHYHPPLSPPPQLTKASLSHLPLSVFEGSLARSVPTTHSGNTWALPTEGLCHFLVFWLSFSFGWSFGTPGWIKKKLQKNDSGKPSLLNPFENS